jgi:NTF2 fold immunity protein
MKVRPTQTQLLDQLLKKRHFTNADLAAIAQLQSIRDITFPSGSTFPEHGLDQLGNMRWLFFLHFHTCVLTARDLADLAALPKLTVLHFTSCAFTNELINHLYPSAHITTLSFTRMPIGGPAVAHIAQFPSLTELNLSGTAVTDTDLLRLTSMVRLKTLVLNDTVISDAGLLSLGVLPQLTGVSGKRSHVTAQGYDALFRAQLETRRKRNKRYRTGSVDIPAMTEAKTALTAFMAALWQWETRVYRDAERLGSTRTSGQHVFMDADRLFWEQLTQEYRRIITNYCTVDYQQHSQNAGYGTPPRVNPLLTEFMEVHQVKKHLLCLYTKEANGDYYEYTMIALDGQWRIDKRRWWIEGGWHLTYV